MKSNPLERSAFLTGYLMSQWPMSWPDKLRMAIKNPNPDALSAWNEYRSNPQQLELDL